MVKVDLESLEDFLEFGLVQPGRDIFIFDKANARHRRYNSLNKKESISNSIDYYARQVYSAIEKALDNIVSQGEVNRFALSGGADSRIILAILLKNHPGFLRDLYIYTRVHPELGPSNDKDFLISDCLSKRFNFKIFPETSEALSSGYLMPIHRVTRADYSRKVLSGLWGGELLGGAIFEFFPTHPEQIIRSKRDGLLKAYLQNLVETYGETCLSSLDLHFHLLYEANCSTFYDSSTWFFPRMANYVSHTPFLQDVFLKEIFVVPSHFFKKYQLYLKIFDLLDKRFSEIEVNNLFFQERSYQCKVGGSEAKMKSQVLSKDLEIDSIYYRLLKEQSIELETSPRGSLLKTTLSIFDYDFKLKLLEKGF